MAKRKKPPARKGREGLGSRLARLANRFFILVTFGLIALYLIPLSTKVVQERGDRSEIAESASSIVPSEPVTVQVLNGCGEPGLALDVSRYLRERGCDVVEMGNADHFHHEETKIIARSGDLASAERVRAVLGFGEVSSSPDPDLLLEVTLVVGADCTPFPARSATE
ncbi:MAG: LytR C-terminal domain-containing protein [Candidatus Eisenbacteria bacterium]